MSLFTLLLISYLLGSIPTALFVSRQFFNIDIREYGSGNAGATNVYRVLGPKWGTFVMIVDTLKGVLAVQLAHLLPEFADTEMALQNVQTLLGLAAVLGHIFPIWADFRGGKGVATIFGMVLGISPITAVSCVTIFSLVLFLTRFVSLSSILAGISFPIFILVVFNVENPVYRVFAITVALLILIMHQKNIGRLLKGKEGKLPILKGRDRRREQQKK